MKLRSTVITAAVSAAAALAATGITYASATSTPVPQQAPAPQQAPVPQQGPAAAPAPRGGDSGQNNNSNNNGSSNNSNSKGNEGNTSKGSEGNGNGKGNQGNGGREDNEYNGGRGEKEGRVLVNERSYSSHLGDCIAVLSGLGANSLNVRNDTRKTVEVFRGPVCDNGAPVAVVGPHSSSYGVHPGTTDGIDVDNGVVASFRLIKRHHGD
ncbi:hypothetical protein [Streptomyces sp. AF1A]|jgi:hypothetical protein|uniref:hypothetical protein n=1 Tax=Streptomyces sp. AF1A TaxID=3394350 RepID=UPI0039BCAFB9